MKKKFKTKRIVQTILNALNDAREKKLISKLRNALGEHLNPKSKEKILKISDIPMQEIQKILADISAIFPNPTIHSKEYEEAIASITVDCQYYEQKRSELKLVYTILPILQMQFQNADKTAILDLAYAIKTGYFYDGTKFKISRFEKEKAYETYDMIEFYRRLPHIQSIMFVPNDIPENLKEAIKIIKKFLKENIKEHQTPAEEKRTKKHKKGKTKTPKAEDIIDTTQIISVQDLKNFIQNSNTPKIQYQKTNKISQLESEEIDIIIDYMSRTKLPITKKIFYAIAYYYLSLKAQIPNNESKTLLFIKNMLFNPKYDFQPVVNFNSNLSSLSIRLSLYDKISIIENMLAKRIPLTEEKYKNFVQTKATNEKCPKYITSILTRIRRQITYTDELLQCIYQSQLSCESLAAKIDKIQKVARIILTPNSMISLENKVIQINDIFSSLPKFDREMAPILKHLNSSNAAKDKKTLDLVIVDYVDIIALIREWLHKVDENKKNPESIAYILSKNSEERKTAKRLKTSKEYELLTEYLKDAGEQHENFNEDAFAQKHNISMAELRKKFNKLQTIACDDYEKYQQITKQQQRKKFEKAKDDLSLVVEAIKKLDGKTVKLSYILATLPFKTPYDEEEFTKYNNIIEEENRSKPRKKQLRKIRFLKTRTPWGIPRSDYKKILNIAPITQKGRVLAFARATMSKKDYVILYCFFQATGLNITDEEINSIMKEEKVDTTYADSTTTIPAICIPKSNKKTSQTECFKLPKIIICFKDGNFNIPTTAIDSNDSSEETKIYVDPTAYNEIKKLMKDLNIPLTNDTFILMASEYFNDSNYKPPRKRNQEALIRVLQRGLEKTQQEN